MENFDRQYRLSIGEAGKQGFTIGEGEHPLRISFSLDKADTTTQNEATISVWNLNKEHKAMLDKKDCMVVLSAGYGNNLALAFCGTVTSSATSQDGADMVTEIHVTDSLVPIRDTYISLSYAGVINGQKIIRDIAAQMGVTVVFAPKVVLKDFANGYTFIGQAKTALTKVCKSCGVEWTLQNGVLQIKKANTTITDRVYVLSAETGLLETPTRISQSAETSSQDNPTNKKNQIGWEVRYVINLAIGINDFVKLESKAATGFFKVNTIKITGDNIGGEWTCTAELLEVTV